MATISKLHGVGHGVAARSGRTGNSTPKMVPSFEPLILLDKKSAKPIYSWLFIL